MVVYSKGNLWKFQKKIWEPVNLWFHFGQIGFLKPPSPAVGPATLGFVRGNLRQKLKALGSWSSTWVSCAWCWRMMDVTGMGNFPKNLGRILFGSISLRIFITLELSYFIFFVSKSFNVSWFQKNKSAWQFCICDLFWDAEWKRDPSING